MSAKTSTELAKQIVNFYRDGLSGNQIAERVGVGTTTVFRCLKREKMPSRGKWESSGPRRFLTDTEKEWVSEQYLSGESIRGIAAKLGYNEETIRRLIERKGHPKRNFFATWDKEFFKVIDTEEKAYWLGFIAADGCVCRGSLRIALQERDRAHLEKFKSAIAYTGEVKRILRKNGRYQAIIAFKCPSIEVDLYREGITEKKSFTCETWKGSKHLMRHYWRGCLDGDGCIHKAKRRGCFRVSFVGTFDMTSGFADYVQGITGFLPRVRSVENIFSVAIDSQRVVNAVLSDLYDNSSISLERKQLMAQEAIARS